MVRGVEDLRTRIAAVVYAHDCWDYSGGLECRCGSQFGFDDDDPQGDAITPWSEHVADAVIRELGLREQTGNDAAYPQVIPCADYLRTHHRFVTDWVADE